MKQGGSIENLFILFWDIKVLHASSMPEQRVWANLGKLLPQALKIQVVEILP